MHGMDGIWYIPHSIGKRTEYSANKTQCISVKRNTCSCTVEHYVHEHIDLKFFGMIMKYDRILLDNSEEFYDKSKTLMTSPVQTPRVVQNPSE